MRPLRSRRKYQYKNRIVNKCYKIDIFISITLPGRLCLNLHCIQKLSGPVEKIHKTEII